MSTILGKLPIGLASKLQGASNKTTALHFDVLYLQLDCIIFRIDITIPIEVLVVCLCNTREFAEPVVPLST
jgi:hypothetical protein